MRRQLCTGVALAFAAIIATGSPRDINATGITITDLGSALTVHRVDMVCISCYAEYDPDHAPNPNYPWFILLAAEDCEDGYSPSGPCIKCVQLGNECEEETDYWSDQDDCDNAFYCDTAPLVDDVEEYLKKGDLESIEKLISSRPTAFRRDDSGTALQVVTCGGKVLKSFTLPAPIFTRHN